MDWMLGAGLFLLATAAAFTALVAVSGLYRGKTAGGGSIFDEPRSETVFLFDDETLLDASDTARALLATGHAKGPHWDRFLAFVVPRFPGFVEGIERLPDVGRMTWTSDGVDPLTLVAEWRGGLRRMTLIDPQDASRFQTLDTLSVRARNEELALLRDITDAAPFPVWRLAPDGTVRWANRAYLDAAGRMLGPEAALSWPLPQIFDGDAPRLRVETAEGETLWFDRAAALPGLPTPDHADATDRTDPGTTLYALPADGAVRAEQALRAFVQTLTKTFAHLPIGLAIFDDQRRLQLFNPALTDLTTLPVSFLSARPTLFGFLDAMRARQMIPEPKDYKSWRHRIAALEAEAAAGQFQETWSLPSGLTYRVLGRPHPEGALALMFEDISDEISRARAFRADLELGQSVIDTMNEAIAVFSPAGAVVMSNAAYAELWSHDPAQTLADMGITASAALWRDRCAPDPVWAKAESFVLEPGAREPWQCHARLLDGRALRCRFVPLAGGATLAGFSADCAADLPTPLPAAFAPARSA